MCHSDCPRSKGLSNRICIFDGQEKNGMVSMTIAISLLMSLSFDERCHQWLSTQDGWAITVRFMDSALKSQLPVSLLLLDIYVCLCSKRWMGYYCEIYGISSEIPTASPMFLSWVICFLPQICVQENAL